MKLLVTVISLIISISCAGQMLDENATLKYINDILYENRKEYVEDSYSHKMEYQWFNEIILSKTGYLTIIRYKKQTSTKFKSYNRSGWYSKRTSHISEIDLNGIKITKSYEEYLVVPCKSGDCWTIKKHEDNKTYYSPSQKVKWEYRHGDSYTKKKLANAIVYLLSSAIQNGTYTRDDDDPFAPKNFNASKYNVTGNSNSTRVPLKKFSGVNKLVVAFGDGQLKEEFILDTGAGAVSISKSLEQKLIAQSLLRREDYISPGLFKIADGSIITCRRLIIPKITVGGFSVYNIVAAVSSGNSPLLLGKNFLDKFSSWSVDNSSNTLILNK